MYTHTPQQQQHVCIVAIRVCVLHPNDTPSVIMIRLIQAKGYARPRGSPLVIVYRVHNSCFNT